MNGRTFYVITTEDENGKLYSYVAKVNNCNNLVGYFPDNAITINACDTLKEARRIAEAWNNDWIEQGRHMFDIPQF